VSKGSPQESCCGPGFWNIQYNSLINLEFGKRTKAIAFADDLQILVRMETVREAENLANVEISKISNFAKDKKIRLTNKYLTLWWSQEEEKIKQRCIHLFEQQTSRTG